MKKYLKYIEMKQIVVLTIIVLFLASCASTTVNNEETKRQELKQYKQDLHELKQKIEVLEKELSANVEEEVINVKVATIQPETFEHFIEVTGKVEAEQDVDVSPESIGVIEDVLVKEGNNVKKGQVLAKLKTDALQRSLDEMNIQLDLANTTYKRQKNLWDQNIGSELQYLQAKTSKESLEKRIEGLKAQMEMAVIKSPIDGIVDIVYQKKGHIGSPQAPFAKVLNTKRVKIYADVAETYLTKIKQGQKAMVNFPALGIDIVAKINRIGNTIDPLNRTFRVRINLDNHDRTIKPNLISIIKVRDYVAEEAIVIPTLLVKEDFNGEYTYVSIADGDKTRAKKVYVSTGITNNNMIEVIEGIEPEMNLITEGYTQVVDGSLIHF